MSRDRSRQQDRQSRRDLALPILALSLGLAVSLGFGIVVVSGPEPAFVTRLPDDSFYYLAIAKNVAETGTYSFDGGQTTTTGFHPLWLHTLVPIARMSAGNDLLFMRLAVGASFLIATAVVSWSSLCLLRRRRTGLLLALALAISSYGFLNGSVSALEWPLAIAAGAAFFGLLASSKSQRPGALMMAFAIGVAGSLARSDFGGVPLVATGLAAAFWWRTGERRFFWPSALVLAGATLGLLLGALQIHSISGEWISGSAQTKAVWGQAFGVNPIPILHQFARALLYVPPLHAANKMELKEQWIGTLSVIGPIALLAGAAAAFLARRSLSRAFHRIRAVRSPHGPCEQFFVVLSLSLIVFYAALYSLNSLGVQSWYTAHVFVPTICLFGLILERALAALGSVGRQTLMLCVLALIMGNLIVFATTPATYSPQSALRRTGIALEQAQAEGDLPGTIGWADAGIVGFYDQSSHVINTDGLANDEIHLYLPNRLHCYPLHKQIRFISSFGWVADEHLLMRDWDSFSRLRIVTGSDGFEFGLREIDFSSLAGFDECRVNPLAHEKSAITSSVL